MRLHVVGLPHTRVTKEFNVCAFTEKVRKFVIMMKAAGHHVTLYAAGHEHETPADEFVSCLSEEDRAAAAGENYVAASWDTSKAHWYWFNLNVTCAIRRRAESRDIICLIGGLSHKPIADAFPNHIVCEFGVGYKGSFAPYRVFESYAWMHETYGRQGIAEGRWFDTVIPGYIEQELFPAPRAPSDYYLFVGRVGVGKGEEIAARVCRELGKTLVVAGPVNTGATIPDGVEYAGILDIESRNRLMAGAIALFAPTQYIEPFGNVVIEAQACGTPTITTDWGAFTETVDNGVNGYRCRTHKEFLEAARCAPHMSRAVIAIRARDDYFLEAIGPQYDAWLKNLSTLWGEGWYSR